MNVCSNPPCARNEESRPRPNRLHRGELFCSRESDEQTIAPIQSRFPPRTDRSVFYLVGRLALFLLDALSPDEERRGLRGSAKRPGPIPGNVPRRWQHWARAGL